VNRNLRLLTETEFDILVVGGGIYGVTIAWDAAQRGLSVALIDRGDFGGGTSLNSLKTVHGGLRSLQRGNVVDTRRFVRERRTFLRIAPHLVEPLRFVIPTYPGGTRSRSVMRMALAVNDLIASDRNDGVDPARRLGPGRVIDRDELLRLFPGLQAGRVTGGAAWYEAQMYNPDRLLLGFVQSAVAAGAVAANYVVASKALRRGDRVVGVTANDGLTGAAFDIRARVTINAAGGWASALTASVLGGRASAGVQMSKAFNVLTRLPAPACGLGNSVDGQFLFCVPWRGIAAFGTFHGAHAATDDLKVRESDVSGFLAALNRAFPAARVHRDDVALVHRGLLPTTGTGRNGEVALTKVSYVRDHRADGAPGLVTVIGVRFTTARRTAEQVVDLAGRVLTRTLRPCRTAATPLAGGDIADINTFLSETKHSKLAIDAVTMVRLARSYGTLHPCLLSMIDADSTLASPLGATCPVTRAEIVYAVRAEMAMRLADALLRRTEAGSAAHPGRDAIEAAAAIMAQGHGWDAARIAAEIDGVEARYRIE